MAIVLEANYAKKLGLPGYSSHQYSVSIRTELTDLSQVEEESARLYRLLQEAVDDSIQQPGYLPGDGEPASAPGSASGAGRVNGPPPPARPRTRTADQGGWCCSDKQRELIEKVVRERQLDKAEIEALAQDRFGAGVRQLNRLQASGLIDELFERYGGRSPARANGKPATRRAFAA